MASAAPLAVCWFRRDLRLEDNAALYHALRSGLKVLPVFIFDSIILDQLDNKQDKRVLFIHQTVTDMRRQLNEMGADMEVLYGKPVACFKNLLNNYPIEAVYTNSDYEVYAQQRDSEIAQLLKTHNAAFREFKDQVIFEKDEVLKDDGRPYTVYTPYSKKWKSMVNPFYLSSYPTEYYFDAFYQRKASKMPSLTDLGFEAVDANFPPPTWNESTIKKYSKQRDFPGIPGTSRLGLHLRFGTISIRTLAREAGALNETFLNELIWRDFYHMITWHFPHVGKGKAFKPAYDQIRWRNDEVEFLRWCEGSTGYPIVDAGMRELNETGYMHNRVRMVVASFLSKHLLIDWRWGEAYFARQLLDYDFAANNGGWQWAAGSGCDAAPYFRIFNPYLQTKKFDADGEYINKWVPEWQELTYPQPMVDHDFARKRCLEAYNVALKEEGA